MVSRSAPHPASVKTTTVRPGTINLLSPFCHHGDYGRRHDSSGGAEVGLTSLGLVAVLAAVAAGLLTGMLWWWPKLAGRGFRMILARIAALGALELTVLVLIFVVVNRSGGFYSSWSDLFGTSTSSGAIIAGQYRTSQAGQAIAPVTVTGSSAVRVPGRARARAGTLQRVRIHGQLSGLTVPGYVYLPAGYSARPAGRPLPVMAVISDQAASPAAPYGARRLSATEAVQVAAGRLRPMIIVMLPARIGRDQGCLNVPGGAQAATFFAQDLPHAIGSAYRAASGFSRRWALLGDSSGGYCALQLALTSSGTFSAAALPPGTYSAPPGSGASAGSPQIRTQDNLAWLLRHRPMQPISVLFTARGLALPLASLARPPMHATSLGLAAGQWPLAPAFDWIGARLAQGALARG
jgi:enterochelin esterase-like enzyme